MLIHSEQADVTLPLTLSMYRSQRDGGHYREGGKEGEMKGSQEDRQQWGYRDLQRKKKPRYPNF